jgi:hypothetical protein
MATSTVKERKRLYCGHCEDYVSKTLYYKHKQIYYDDRSKKWSKERVLDNASSLFVFSASSTNDYPGEVIHKYSTLIRELEYWKNQIMLRGVGGGV